MNPRRDGLGESIFVAGLVAPVGGDPARIAGTRERLLRVMSETVEAGS
jgi:hypothetical protein